MTEHSFGCLSDQEAMGLHDLSKAQVYQKPKEMTELEKEVEDKGIKYADSLEYTISKFSDEEGYCWSQVEKAYEKGALDFAEPREKRIAKLEKRCANYEMQLSKMEKGICDICKETEKDKRIAEFEAQIEKMKSDYEQLLDEKIELEDRFAESRECY